MHKTQQNPHVKFSVVNLNCSNSYNSYKYNMLKYIFSRQNAVHVIIQFTYSLELSLNYLCLELSLNYLWTLNFKKRYNKCTMTLDLSPCIKILSIALLNKKHIDASVKERPQTLLFPSEEICNRVLCINIFNTIYYFKPTNFNCA